MWWPLPVTFTEILFLRNSTFKSPLSQSNHTLLLTLCSEFDAVLKTEIFLQAQLAGERDRSCFSYSINTDATVQYFVVFTFSPLSCTLTYFKWIQTRGIKFNHAISKLSKLTDQLSKWRHFLLYFPRINTQSFICTSNPWWERLYRLISATDLRALRCHCMMAANWKNGNFFLRFWYENVRNGWNTRCIMNFSCFLEGKSFSARNVFEKRNVYSFHVLNKFNTKQF